MAMSIVTSMVFSCPGCTKNGLPLQVFLGPSVLQAVERRVPWPARCVPGLQGRLSRSALRGEARLCSLCSCSLRGAAQSGGSGCQGGDPWRAMGRGACASGLDAGATRGLPCVVSREEEQQGGAGEQHASLGDQSQGTQRAGLARGLEAQHRGPNERPNDLQRSAATRGGCGAPRLQQRGIRPCGLTPPHEPGAVQALPWLCHSLH